MPVLCGRPDVIVITDEAHRSQCVCVGKYDVTYDISGYAPSGAAVDDNRIYVAAGDKGLLVLCSVPNVQYMMRVDAAAPGTPCVIEATPTVFPAPQWSPIFTNAAPSGPFEFTDFDVRISKYPQKFYRARQPFGP